MRLDHLPGRPSQLSEMAGVRGRRRRPGPRRKTIAMEYVPRNANPYVSRVDAGTIELVKSLRRRGRAVGRPDPDVRGLLGRRPVGHAPGGGRSTRPRPTTPFGSSSANGPAAAARSARPRCSSASSITFQRHGLTTDHPPIVGVGPHSGDPHYEPKPGSDGVDQEGRFRARRPVGQARQAASGLQRSDPGRVRRPGRARRSTSRSSTSSPPPATRRFSGSGMRSRSGSNCTAGRSIGRPAT